MNPGRPSYTGTASGTVYVVVDDPDRLFTSAWPGLTESRATLHLEMASGTAPGRYTQPVVIKVCKDAACTRQFAGSPQTVPKDILVEEMKLGATALSFSARIGVGAAAQQLTVTPPPGKSFDYAELGVEHRRPEGYSTWPQAHQIFDITKTASGLSITPKAASEGTYLMTVAINSPEYKQRRVNITYEVSGKGEALTFLNTTLTASSRDGDVVFVTLDAVRNVPYGEMRISTTGNPDPVETSWLQYVGTETITLGDGPANNGVRFRFRFSRCGYSVSNCLGSGTYSGNVRLDIPDFNQTWTYNLPATFMVP